MKEKEKTPADLQARVEKLEKSLNNTWLIMDMLILALEQKQVISKADLKEAASKQRSEILKVHPEFAEASGKRKSASETGGEGRCENVRP